MSAFNTCIRQDGILYQVTISVEGCSTYSSEAMNFVHPKGAKDVTQLHSTAAMEDLVNLDYVVYTMDNILVDNIQFSDKVLLREFVLYAEQNDLFKRGY